MPQSANQAPTGAWELPGDLVMLRKTVARFMEREIRPVEERQPHDACRLPDGDLARLQEKARALGLWCLASPPQFGAFGCDPPNVIWSGTADQRVRYSIPAVAEGRKCFVAISESEGGSDPARKIETRAVRDGSDYVINATRMWITGAGDADRGLVFARTGEAGRGDAIMEVVSVSCCSTVSIRGSPVICAMPAPGDCPSSTR